MADDLRARYKRRFEEDLEPERYEIFDLLGQLTPDRREFLSVLGGGLFFLVRVHAQGRQIPVRVQVTETGLHRAFTGKMEMGQGSRTLLTQAFAEELRVPVDRVELVMGDTRLCPDDGGTWSSLTTPQTVPIVRQAAAAVRAARTGGAEVLTAPADWQMLGSSVRRVNSLAIVTGAKLYPSDLTAPGMLHAAIVRSPHHRATLTSVDAAGAEALDGVRVVRDADLLAALAENPATARRAAAAIRAEWQPQPLTPQNGWPALFRATAVEPVEQPRARYPPLLEVARALDVPEARVRIIAVDSGGAFGGKQRGECEVEAARLSRLAGAPVRVAWTREEEFTCSYTRPAGLLEIESGMDAGGRFTAMRFANYNSGAAGITPPYEIPHHWIGFYRTRSDVRQGSYRSLAGAANAFARESHIDEWADDLQLDPVELRLRNITDTRLREVIERTAARFGWGQRRNGNGRGTAMSCNLEKDARLALFVEVEADGSTVRVVRMVATGDFGAALNPDNLRNQMTGALIQGLGGALWEQVVFDTTSQRTRRLADYRVPRFSDIPAMDVQLIDRREVAPAGAGESPITLTAPAVASAVFAATGERLRTLPLAPARSSSANVG